MKRKTLLTIVAAVTAIVAFIYLIVLLLWGFGVLDHDAADETLFVNGYAFLPVPVVGLLAGILLQVFTVRSKKRKNNRQS
jgi:hypothetical protein